MAGKQQKPRGLKVSLDWKIAKAMPVPLADGFAIPESFGVRAVIEDPRLGTITAAFPVVVEGGRARVRSIEVSTDRANGIGYDVLRAVPIRDIVAHACSEVLLRVEVTGNRSAKMTPVLRLFDTDEAEATLAELGMDEPAAQAIRTLVGWRDGAGK